MPVRLFSISVVSAWPQGKCGEKRVCFVVSFFLSFFPQHPQQILTWRRSWNPAATGWILADVNTGIVTAFPLNLGLGSSESSYLSSHGRKLCFEHVMGTSQRPGLGSVEESGPRSLLCHREVPGFIFRLESLCKQVWGQETTWAWDLISNRFHPWASSAYLRGR